MHVAAKDPTSNESLVLVCRPVRMLSIKPEDDLESASRSVFGLGEAVINKATAGAKISSVSLEAGDGIVGTSSW